jgi:subfamily B ATP-binding cassette protein MsbA
LKEESTQKNGWSVYKRLISIALKDNTTPLVFAIFGMLITALSDPALSAIMKPILDGGFINRDQSIISLLPLGLFTIFFLRSVGIFLTIYFMAKVGRSLVFRLREQMFDKLLNLPVSFYDKSSSGDLMSRISHNVELLASVAARSLIILIRDTLTIIGLLVWMFYLSWELTLFFITAAPFIVFLVSSLNKKFRQLTHDAQNSVGSIIHVAQEIIQGSKIVKIYNGYTKEINRFGETNTKNESSHMKLAFTEGINSAVIMLIVGSSLSGIILISTFDFILQSITVGSFVSFMFAMFMILGPARGLASINARLQQGIAAGENVFQLIDEISENDSGSISHVNSSNDIIFSNVNFQYENSDVQVLNNINLTIKTGEFVAIVGMSGCGKSTLVNLIPRLYNPNSGSILINNINIKDLKLNTLRDSISYVGQDTILFNDTVRNNIAYGKDNISDIDIIEALEKSYAIDFVNDMPNSINTMIGENGVLLSGGQRQRLAIARAFLKNSNILIFDEATSSLDSVSEKYIQTALNELKLGKTTIIIAHRLSTVESANNIIVMDKGKIIESGSHKNLISNKSYYYKLYNSQVFK